MDTSQYISFPGLIFATSGMFTIMAFAFYGLFLTYKKRIEQEQTALREAEVSFLKQLNDSIIAAEQNERSKIAMDMHDEIGTLITLLRMNVGFISKNQDSSQNSNIQKINELLDQTHLVFKQISDRISPSTLSKLGLNADFIEMLNEFKQATGVEVKVDSQLDKKRFENDIEINTHRIVKELINNILKYGNANNLHFRAFTKKNRLEIHLSYEGKGLTNTDVEQLLRSGKQLGLKSIQARINHLKGKIDYSTIKNELWQINVEIPIP